MKTAAKDFVTSLRARRRRSVSTRSPPPHPRPATRNLGCHLGVDRGRRDHGRRTRSTTWSKPGDPNYFTNWDSGLAQIPSGLRPRDDPHRRQPDRRQHQHEPGHHELPPDRERHRVGEQGQDAHRRARRQHPRARHRHRHRRAVGEEPRRDLGPDGVQRLERRDRRLLHHRLRTLGRRRSPRSPRRSAPAPSSATKQIKTGPGANDWAHDRGLAVRGVAGGQRDQPRERADRRQRRGELHVLGGPVAQDGHGLRDPADRLQHLAAELAERGVHAQRRQLLHGRGDERELRRERGHARCAVPAEPARHRRVQLPEHADPRVDHDQEADDRRRRRAVQLHAHRARTAPTRRTTTSAPPAAEQRRSPRAPRAASTRAPTWRRRRACRPAGRSTRSTAPARPSTSRTRRRRSPCRRPAARWCAPS